MGRRCSICQHPRIREIDSALAADEAIRGLARTFSVSEDALSRHKKRHLPVKIVKATEARERMEADRLLALIEGFIGEAGQVVVNARRSGDDALKLKAIKTAGDLAVNLAKITTGDGGNQVTVQILVQLREQMEQMTEIFKEALRHETDPQTALRIVTYIERRTAALTGPLSG